ncbi:hypothetical protein MMC14_006835 [Varicellaria rhodocarpa]|nr:hypothetical protein [Varicellaria rhodocarpa]
MKTNLETTSLIPYVRFMVCSIKEEITKPKLPFNEIASYLNKLPPLTKAKFELTQDHASVLYNKILRIPSEVERYKYIFQERCSPAYQMSVLEGMLRSKYKDMGDEDLALEGWIQDKDIVENDRKAGIKSNSEATAEAEAKEMQQRGRRGGK